MATSLGNGLRHRYMVSGGPSDIARAVSLHERIADVPADLATRGLRLTNLVASVMSRYFRNGDLADLESPCRGRSFITRAHFHSLECCSGWTSFKKRLAFAEVTQDGDSEGVFSGI
jgi:hypothetical protein